MGQVLGRYELLHKIAAGGMGEVFLARHQGHAGFEKFLVIKTLLPHLVEDPEFVKMFFDEARIAALLSHPNIVQIFDLGESAGVYFIAMEYVHGETLKAIASAAAAVPGGLTLGLKCRIIAGAAQALEHAHDARDSGGRPMDLIHRDVSPHNIMVAFSGVVKLVDFGIAKANNKLARTATGIVRGKYAYMSPEQAYGRPLDRRSDVFSLGIVFHELLTGQRLFGRKTQVESMRAVSDAPIPIPSEGVKGIPKALDQIVLKALSRKLEDRYQSCGQLRADLEGLIVRQRLPATPARLSDFMVRLFPEASRPDALLRRSQREEAAGDDATKPGSEVSAAVPAVKAETALDPEQLVARLAGCSASDQLHGLFFNAIEAAVLKSVGVVGRMDVRNAAEAPREWVDSICYPTREFLRVLWRGVEALVTRTGGIEAAFTLIGREAFALLLATPSAAALSTLPLSPSPLLVVRPLIGLLQPMVRPGSRRVGDCTASSAQVIFKGEVLPIQLYSALVLAAVTHFQGARPQVSWEKTTPDRVEFNLRW